MAAHVQRWHFQTNCLLELENESGAKEQRDKNERSTKCFYKLYFIIFH